MNEFFHKINTDDFVTLNITIINSQGKEIGYGTFGVDEVVTYDTILDVEGRNASYVINCEGMTYDAETDVYTVNDGGVIFQLML